MAKERLTGVVSIGNTATRDGQVFRFRCAPEDLDLITGALGKAEELRPMNTKRAFTKDGTPYGQMTRFDIKQHDYAGGQDEHLGGYVEAIEIKDPPAGRASFVLYQWSTNLDAFFAEFDSLENLLAAFENTIRWDPSKRVREKASACDGLLRIVDSTMLTPWFYAIGSQLIIGDFAFPEDMQDDLVFKAGQLCRITEQDHDGVERTCLGCRLMEAGDTNYYGQFNNYHALNEPKRVLFFDDGSAFIEGGVSLAYAWHPLGAPGTYFKIEPAYH